MNDLFLQKFEETFASEGLVAEFQQTLESWFKREGKSYPWRETEDPYAILVSELMLQQTRIAAVLGKGYFTRWMKRFPTWDSLAKAEEEEILKAWEGLGYYNRARNLQKAAQAVSEIHGGKFPREIEQILALPGVGRYTAGAVLSFAFDERAPIVDGNVIRVLARIFGFTDPVDTTTATKLFWSWADRLTPSRQVRVYNSAIMELGQQCCTRTAPNCVKCPVSEWCGARKEGNQDQIPTKKAKKVITEKQESVGIATSGNRILLAREEGGRRKGLWRLPELSLNEVADFEELFRFNYAITRYRVNLRVHRLPLPLAMQMEEDGIGKWHGVEGAPGLPPLGSPYQKAIRKFREIEGNLL